MVERDFFLFILHSKFDFFSKVCYNKRGNININIFIHIFVRKSNFDKRPINKKEKERDYPSLFALFSACFAR